MAGRGRTLAAAIVTALSAWDQLPEGVTVARVRNVSTLIKDLPEDTPAVIAVIVAETEDQSQRGEIAEDIAVGMVLIANCASHDATASDSWDELTEKLRDFLRSNSAFKVITLSATVSAQRKSVSTTVVCDADMMDTAEIFVSVTEGVWYCSIGNRS